jgi:hypothetical protein
MASTGGCVGILMFPCFFLPNKFMVRIDWIFRTAMLKCLCQELKITCSMTKWNLTSRRIDLNDEI